MENIFESRADRGMRGIHPSLAKPGGISLRFFSETVMFVLEIAQQYVLAIDYKYSGLGYNRATRKSW